MSKLQLWHFLDRNIPSDIINDKGRVIRFKEVFCIADSESHARIKSNLDEGYTLIEIRELGEGWN